MAIPVQTASVSVGNATQATNTAAWGVALTVGNRVLVAIAIGGSTNNPSPTVSSVSLGTDALSLITGAAVSNGSGNLASRVEIWGGTVATAGQKTLTVNASALACINADAAEYNGTVYTLTLDGAAVTATGTSSTPTTGNITTTNANDLLFAGFSEHLASGTTVFTLPTNSFTIEKTTAQLGAGNGNAGTSGQTAGCTDLVTSATGTFSTGVTLSGVSLKWCAVIVAFQKVAAIVNVGVPPRHRVKRVPIKPPVKFKLRRLAAWNVIGFNFPYPRKNRAAKPPRQRFRLLHRLAHPAAWNIIGFLFPVKPHPKANRRPPKKFHTPPLRRLIGQFVAAAQVFASIPRRLRRKLAVPPRPPRRFVRRVVTGFIFAIVPRRTKRPRTVTLPRRKSLIRRVVSSFLFAAVPRRRKRPSIISRPVRRSLPRRVIGQVIAIVVAAVPRRARKPLKFPLVIQAQPPPARVRLRQKIGQIITAVVNEAIVIWRNRGGY